MNRLEQEYIVVGRFGRPHGIKGFLTVHSFTTPKDNIIEYFPWFIYLNRTWQKMNILDLSCGSRMCLALVEGYEIREKAALLTNYDIAVPRNVLPKLPQGEYYWHELVGMQAVNTSGVNLGCVDSLLATGAHDVLVLKYEDQTRMIPYVMDRIVLHIDKKTRKIVVDWEEDYFD